MDLLDRFLAHNTWTTSKLTEQSQGLSDAQLDQESDIGLKTVRATHDHIIKSIEYWTDLINARPQRGHDYLGADPMTLDGFAKRLERVSEEFAEVARRVQEAGQLGDTWPPRGDLPKAYSGTTILHITHSAHHRAQQYLLKGRGVEDVIMAHGLRW